MRSWEFKGLIKCIYTINIINSKVTMSSVLSTIQNKFVKKKNKSTLINRET